MQHDTASSIFAAKNRFLCNLSCAASGAAARMTPTTPG
jgi:hypothetical protein